MTSKWRKKCGNSLNSIIDSSSTYTKIIRILGGTVAGLALVSLCYRLFDILEATIGWVFPYWDSSFRIMLSIGGLGFVLAVLSLIRWNDQSWKIDVGIQFFVRLWVALSLINAGVSKLLDTQFNLPEYVKDTPIIDLQGFHLTWYYFGYSQGFQNVVGLSQILGSLLLLSRKTRLLGAVVLFPVVLNILMVNIFFQINPYALIEISLLSLGVIYLLLIDFDKLWKTFLAIPNQGPRLFKRQNLLRNVAVVLVIAAGVFLRFLIGDGDENKTFLRGVWVVDKMEVSNDSTFYVQSFDKHLSKLYFEYYTDQQVIMEFDDPKLRRFIGSRLDTVNRTLTFEIDGAPMPLFYDKTDSLVYLEGIYKGDSVSMSIRRIRESTK